MMPKLKDSFPKVLAEKVVLRLDYVNICSI